MKRVLVRSLHDAFDYVMAHFYPADCEEFAVRTDPMPSFPFRIPTQAASVSASVKITSTEVF